MFYLISRFLLEVFARIVFRVSFSGREKIPEPPFIITSNHASLIDPPLIGVACKKYPVDFMAKKELFDKPVLGAWSRAVQCIEVKRGENSVASIKEAIRRLKDGKVVGVFPEGTRTADGSLQEAKRGIGFLVARAHVPVVPCYVHGSREAFPKGSGVRWGARIRVYVGNPIQPNEFDLKTGSGKTDYEAVANLIMDRIADLKPQD